MYLGDTSTIGWICLPLVWSCILLTGTSPFLGTAEKVMFKLLRDPAAPSVAGRLPSLQSFDSVVMKALARRPEDRFSSAAQFWRRYCKLRRTRAVPAARTKRSSPKPAPPLQPPGGI